MSKYALTLIGVRVGTAYTGPWVRERSRTLILEHELLLSLLFFALEPKKAHEMIKNP